MLNPESWSKKQWTVPAWSLMASAGPLLAIALLLHRLQCASSSLNIVVK